MKLWKESGYRCTNLVDEQGEEVGYIQIPKDAAYIVQAVNAHDGLVKALENILAMKPLTTATSTDLWLHRGEVESLCRAALTLAKKEN